MKPIERRVLDLKNASILVDGAYVAGAWLAVPDSRSFTVNDPFDGALIVAVPLLGVEAARRAIDKAGEVDKDWARHTTKERSGTTLPNYATNLFGLPFSRSS